MGIPLHEGRLFTAQDRAEAVPVVIVNRAMARRYWPGQSPIGRRIKRGTPAAPFPWMTVVGVVGDVKQGTVTGEVPSTVFLPYLQTPSSGMTLVVRSDSDPVLSAGHIREVLRTVDKDQPVTDIRPLSDVHWTFLSGRRIPAAWMGIFAALALLLAAMGVYGVVTYAVAKRTREFGIRIALGADGRALLLTALRDGMAPIAIGVVVGLAGAAAVTRLLATQLYQVEPTDAVTFAGAATTLLMAGALASYLPARRAVATDPVTALRSE
jgi:putative ABC transport system permease protein